MKKILFSLVFLASVNTLMAKDCSVSIEATEGLTYNIKEIKIQKDCTNLSIKLSNADDDEPKEVMAHNLVISETKDMKGIADAALKAGKSKDYMPSDKKIIAHTKLLGGLESDTIVVPVKSFKKGNDYSYFCTFPGHFATMKGKIILE